MTMTHPDVKIEMVFWLFKGNFMTCVGGNK
jgi:hypothetical protein